MKTTRNIFICIALAVILLLPTMVAGQKPAKDSSYVKTGWSVVPLPALSYSSDLGFQLGAIAEVYYFGDGSTYPDYLHKFMAEACYYTKGSGIYHIFYDSKYLIKDLRLTAAVSYIPNTMMQFFGFNGYASPFLDNKNGAFYFTDRNMLRVLGDLQGQIAGNFRWAAGISFYHYAVGKVKAKKYKDDETLYDIYLENGIIREDEKNGGGHLEFRVGAVYDTRDHEPDPTSGMYADVILYGSPDVITRRGYNYMKAAASFRHYIPVIRKRLTFAYRLAYQVTVAGSAPFYVQQTYTTLFLKQINAEILGGAISLRGVAYNRVVGNGMAWANAELRLRLFEFNFLGQHWYLGVNPFFDAGMVVQPYRLGEMKESGVSEIYSGDKESLHLSGGIGGKVVMNDNFVLSAEFGWPLDKRDGKSGIYLNLNYVF